MPRRIYVRAGSLSSLSSRERMNMQASLAENLMILTVSFAVRGAYFYTRARVRGNARARRNDPARVPRVCPGSDSRFADLHNVVAN